MAFQPKKKGRYKVSLAQQQGAEEMIALWKVLEGASIEFTGKKGDIVYVTITKNNQNKIGQQSFSIIGPTKRISGHITKTARQSSMVIPKYESS